MSQPQTSKPERSHDLADLTSMWIKKPGDLGRPGWALCGTWSGYSAPLIYLRKPSYMSDEEFEAAVEALRVVQVVA